MFPFDIFDHGPKLVFMSEKDQLKVPQKIVGEAGDCGEAG